MSGVAVCLAQEVVNSAFVDLNPIVTESSASSKPSTEALLQTPQPSNRKRKHGTSIASLELHKTSSLEVGTPKKHTRCSIAVQIAALEALEALLTVVRVLQVFIKNVGSVHLCVWDLWLPLWYLIIVPSKRKFYERPNIL